MKTIILTILLMFTTTIVTFSGNDITLSKPTTTTEMSIDVLKPSVPQTATFDDEVTVDTTKTTNE